TASAAPIVVNGAGDAPTPEGPPPFRAAAAAVVVDGVCTLREAIQNANDNAQTNPDCAAGSGADTITFDPNTLPPNTVITLAAGELVITDSLTINGVDVTNL